MEIKLGYEVGYKNSNKYIHHACEDCGKLRWELVHSQPGLLF